MKGVLKLKIAIACSLGLVSDHFGHSDSFEIFSIAENKPIFMESLMSPAHQHGAYPIFLKKHGVDILICGTIGRGAIELMSAQNIEVISGAEGTIDEITNQYVEGKLVSNHAECSGHDHNHNHDHECHHD